MTRTMKETRWDGYEAAALARAVDVPMIDLHDEVGSTMDIAHRLAERGALAGTVVLADAQRSGRGRMGRSWTSAPGAGVWCTIVERPMDLRALDVLSLRAGLAVAHALDAVAGETVGLKWPNDLFVAAGKLGGILVEARWSGGVPAWIAVGVGINVVAPDVDGGAGLPPGTKRIDVLARVTGAVRRATSIGGWLTQEEIGAYRERDRLAGRRLELPAAGRARGITPSGSLIIETRQGMEQHRAGTIHYAEDA
jgi:BirA family biotin operon repressor/biotin-[acetyl-CoA-carboxylase] ligase